MLTREKKCPEICHCTIFTIRPFYNKLSCSHFLSFEIYSSMCFFLLLLLLHSFEAIFPHCQPYKYTYIFVDYGCIEVHDDDISVTVVTLLAAKFIWERWQKWMNNWNMAAPTKPTRNVGNENGPTKRKKCKPFKVKWFNLNMRKISLSFSFNFCRLLPALTVT